MIKEFEGKSESDAIQKAVETLGLNQDDFEVEIINEEKGFLFKKGNVKIRIHYAGYPGDEKNSDVEKADGKQSFQPDPEDISEAEEKLRVFIKTTIEKMGYSAQVVLHRREDGKIVLNVETDKSSIIIGRKGKNLDALQLLANVYAGKLNEETGQNLKVVVDTEDYRARREENLIRLAEKTAEQVVRSKKSRLLEPMNPFERRLIHTSLNENHDILTKSEGEGLYKQIRIIYKGSR